MIPILYEASRDHVPATFQKSLGKELAHRSGSDVAAFLAGEGECLVLVARWSHEGTSARRSKRGEPDDVDMHFFPYIIKIKKTRLRDTISR